MAPCPVPFDGVHGTLQFSSTGLLTAVDPAECTWTNLNQGTTQTQPAWVIDGDYIVTATYKGVTSQPIYVPIGSAAGVVDPNNNPTGQCGPTSRG